MELMRRCGRASGLRRGRRWGIGRSRIWRAPRAIAVRELLKERETLLGEVERLKGEVKPVPEFVAAWAADVLARQQCFDYAMQAVARYIKSVAGDHIADAGKMMPEGGV